jgi:chloride channel protein, CIC family
MREHFRITGHKSIYITSALVGVLSGVFAAVFSYLIELSTHFLAGLNQGHLDTVVYNQAKGGFQMNYNWDLALLILLLPCLGGLFAGILVYFFAPEASGMGTDSMIHAFHHKEGKMSAKVPLIKSIATIITLSSGGSGGKEGPISQIGAGLGAMVADLVKAGARARRTLLLAGTAGGLGAIFHAPLGGALTAAEMVYKEDVESDALIPCILSSSTAYLVSQKIAPSGTVFHLQSQVFYSYKEFPFYFILGVLCYLFGKVFILFYRQINSQFETLKLPPFLKPAIGGLFVGLVALFFPEATGTGEKFLQKLLNGEFLELYASNTQVSLLLFMGLLILKIFTTTFTVGSGGSAGVFGPSLFSGAMLGGACAIIASAFLGNVSEAGFMLVGMGAFYSGIASAPIAGMIMVCEMIGSYELLPPLMIVTIISFTLSDKLSIYQSQLLNRFSTPAHFWDMNQDIMSNIRLHNVSEYFRRIALIQNDIPLKTLETKAEEIHASDFVVVTPDNQYFGFLSFRKLKNFHESREHIRDLVLTMDLANTEVAPVLVTGTLKDAFDAVLREDIDKVPIVRQDGFVLGYLRIADLFNIYYKFIKKK